MIKICKILIILILVFTFYKQAHAFYMYEFRPNCGLTLHAVPYYHSGPSDPCRDFYYQEVPGGTGYAAGGFDKNGQAKNKPDDLVIDYNSLSSSYDINKCWVVGSYVSGNGSSIVAFQSRLADLQKIYPTGNIPLTHWKIGVHPGIKDIALTVANTFKNMDKSLLNAWEKSNCPAPITKAQYDELRKIVNSNGGSDCSVSTIKLKCYGILNPNANLGNPPPLPSNPNNIFNNIPLDNYIDKMKNQAINMPNNIVIWNSSNPNYTVNNTITKIVTTQSGIQINLINNNITPPRIDTVEITSKRNYIQGGNSVYYVPIFKAK